MNENEIYSTFGHLQLTKHQKTMKLQSSWFTLLLIMFIGAGTLTLTSCTKKGCTTLESDNFDPDAKKDDGSCIPWRNKFIASYTYNEVCDGDSYSGSITITPSSLSSSGLIIALNDGFDTYTFNATVVDFDRFTIPNQTMNMGGASITIEGTGTISGSNMSITYTMTAAGFALTCQVTAIKQ